MPSLRQMHLTAQRLQATERPPQLQQARQAGRARGLAAARGRVVAWRCAGRAPY